MSGCPLRKLVGRIRDLVFMKLGMMVTQADPEPFLMHCALLSTVWNKATKFASFSLVKVSR